MAYVMFWISVGVLSLSKTIKLLKWKGPGIRHPLDSHTDALEGEISDFPLPTVAKAPCLPSRANALRPRGTHPLEPPMICEDSQIIQSLSR
jgi:hypothetical protein